MQHLTEQQQRELKQHLQQELQRLRGEIRDELLRSDNEHYADLAGQVRDVGDDAVADLLVDTNVSTVGRLITEFREVEAALKRFDTASYGLCEQCGIEIPYERLKAYPSARRCLEHQAEHERLYAGEGHPKL